MPFCPNCGTQVPDGVRFCPSCGAGVAPGAAPAKSQLSQDAADNRFISIFCYMSLLLIIPAILKKDSPFVRYHINQGLALLLLQLCCVVACIIPILGWIAAAVAEIFAFVCLIMGIVYAASGKTKPLPLIGSLHIYNVREEQ